MNLFEQIYVEPKLTKEYDASMQKAISIFDEQKDAIKEIKKLKGYKLIKQFLNDNKQATINLLLKSKKDRLKAKERYLVCSELLEFLENLENAK